MHPPPGGQFQQPGPKPDNHLVIAILTTLMCCLPFGIVSIVNATKVDAAYASGNYQEAVSRSEDAKKWAIWAAIGGAVISLVTIVFYIIIFALAAKDV